MSPKARKEGKGVSSTLKKIAAKVCVWKSICFHTLSPCTVLAAKNRPKGKEIGKRRGKTIQRAPLESGGSRQVESQAEQGKTDGRGDEELHGPGAPG